MSNPVLSTRPSSANTSPEIALRLSLDELNLVLDDLREGLDDATGARTALHHLVFVEHALNKKGLKALHKLPLPVLHTLPGAAMTARVVLPPLPKGSYLLRAVVDYGGATTAAAERQRELR